jgi:hypothetical protein
LKNLKAKEKYAGSSQAGSGIAELGKLLFTNLKAKREDTEV